MASVDLTSDERRLLWGQRRNKLQEALLAYLLVAPATIVTFIFGIYPVAVQLWKSLQGGRPIPDKYIGLNNYINASGSLIYFFIAILSVIFCFQAFAAWKRLRNEYELYPEDRAWLYVLPGFFLASGLFLLATVFILAGTNMTYMWLPLVLLAIGIAGYGALGRHTQGNAGIYILNSWLCIQLTLLAVLFSAYAYEQIQEDTEPARRIAQDLLTTEVNTAAPLLSADDVNPQLVNVGLPEDIPVTVEINDEIYEGQLDPAAFENVATEDISAATVTLSRNQRVPVLLELPRGLGMRPITYRTEGSLQLEGNQLLGGESTLEVPLVLSEEAAVYTEQDVFFSGDVGTEVLNREAYTMPVQYPLNATLGVFIALATVYFIGQTRSKFDENTGSRVYFWLGILRLFMVIAAVGFFVYVVTAVQLYRDAAEGMRALATDANEPFRLAYTFVYGEAPSRALTPDDLAAELLFMPQLVSMALGAFLIWVAYLVWQNARHRETSAGFGAYLLLASMLMVGGWLLLGDLPQTITSAGDNAVEVRDALIRTAIYSIGTVPVQLTLGLFLAYLLFYEVGLGKSLFRLIYFMPYITPQIATATIFTVIFSLEAKGLANQFINLFGLGPLDWLLEPNGVVRVLYEELGGNPNHIPPVFEGPSLALTAIIFFNIWVYSGYNAVIFLAGLGSIPGELYEAAKVDGAGRWAAFRHITFPLLSPVTFFLSMLAIIGTFRAFGSIYVLRDQNADTKVDTLSIEIFTVFWQQNDTGYASALAFILFGVILILTVAQTQFSKGRVFYG